MRTLWQYLKLHRGWVFLALLLAAVAQILQLIDPLILGRVIDDYVLNPTNLPQEELIRGAAGWLLLALGISLTARLASTIQDYILTLIAQSAGKHIFDDGLRQTLRLSFQEYDDTSSGEALAVLQKVRADSQSFIMSAVDVFFSTIISVGFILWYAVTRSWLLIPVFIIGVVILGGLTGLLSQRVRLLQRAVVKDTSRAYGSITESVRNIELIKSLGLTRSEVRRLQVYTQRIFDLEMEKVRKVRSIRFLQGTIINVLKQSILFILLWLIFANVLSTGELVSLQVILNTVFGPMQQMGTFVLSYREAEASLQNFEQLMQRPVEQRPEEPVDLGPLETFRFEDVVFRHRNAQENAVDGVSFSAALGDTIAFVGPSGSGKSTLVKLLVGLYRPTAGTIFIDEVPANDIRYNRFRRQIGFVTQDPQLFSGTIRENLQFVSPDATDKQMMKALEMASALELMERSGQGLDTRLGEGGRRVSGGERQRLSIARALLREPRLLIFDEATSALDSLTEREITNVIRDVSSDSSRIVILIAHRLSTIAHADTIYVLERGRVVEQGGHDDLLAKPGLYFAMWRQQAGERDARLIVPELRQPATAGESPAIPGSG
jgi:ATP-binding cassette subfamily B protein